MIFKIPIYQPSLDGTEKKYVNECLDSTWISSKGRFIPEFERKFAQYDAAEKWIEQNVRRLKKAAKKR